MDARERRLEELVKAIEALRSEIAALRGERQSDIDRIDRAIGELAAETQALRSDLVGRTSQGTTPAPRHPGSGERVGLFVDVQNMYYAARQHNARLDFGALMSAAARNGRLIKAVAYVVQNPDIDQSSFLTMLQQKNYEVRRKNLKVRHDGSSKGDWDMEIAIDILRLASSLDLVVLVSGDGDFTSLVTQVKTMGPRVEVYSFPESTANELMEAADKHVPIDEEFLIRMTPSG